MQNVSGTMTVCELLGIGHEDFYRAIASFNGAGRRMQLLGERGESSVYLDFAHAPSKVRATTTALKEQFPRRHLTAVLELHTFSSLNAEFLPRYGGTMDAADDAMVYFNPATVAHKKLPGIRPEQIRDAFGKKGLRVYDDAVKLIRDLRQERRDKGNLLIMTSGNFDGQDLEGLARAMLSEPWHDPR